MDTIKKLRETYKPTVIKCLFLAESPPLSQNGSLRFFYNPKEDKYDFLFKAIMDAIFPDFKKEYKKGDKEKYLKKFEDKGFYLIDATDKPINKESNKNKQICDNLENKTHEIKTLISKNTPIIIIKKNVFTIFQPKLKKEKIKVLNKEFIPFPSHGNQEKFKKIFKKYLPKKLL